VEDVDMSQGKERLFLRQWIGEKVSVVTREQWKYSGQLTNIVFDGTRLMYITLDDKQCLNFDHIVEISLQGE
jgi:small nuclear ribonucleoprotein (snRNP)-like protein